MSSEPRLVYTRRYGWVIIRPTATNPDLAGYTRPGGFTVGLREIIAEAPMPKVPDYSVTSPYAWAGKAREL